MEKGVILTENWLNEVIFRIDYTTILSLTDNNKSAADNFHKTIFDLFPYVNIESQKHYNLNIMDNTKFSKNEKDILCWIFMNEDSNKEISLTANNLVLHYKKGAYKSFKYFIQDIKLIISALKEYSPFKLEFMGLRYINQITDLEINENIGEYINNTLSSESVIEDFNDDEELVQIFTKLNMKKEDYLLSIQYGFFNPSFPNPRCPKHFILDYDCFTHNINSINNIKEKLEEMNKLIFKKFEYSITDKFIEKMGEKYDSS